jgi:hypothetical protein
MIDPIEMEAAQSAPDWVRIEADYRAGLLSLRAIAAKDGHVTEGAIRKKARKLEWARDLTVRVRARAEELVRKDMVRSVGPRYATASEPSERAIVEDNAQILAHVELTQRRDISRARAIVVTLFSELETVTGERLSQDLLDRIENSYEDDKAAAGRVRGAFIKAVSLPSRAGTVKALADALRTLIMLEREAWGIGGDGRVAPATSGQMIDSSKLTWTERQQLRNMILKATAPAVIADQTSGETD